MGIKSDCKSLYIDVVVRCEYEYLMHEEEAQSEQPESGQSFDKGMDEVRKALEPGEVSGTEQLSSDEIAKLRAKRKHRRLAIRVAEMRDANIRLLTLLWCLWLLGAWLAVAFVGGGKEGVRWMVFGAAAGLLGVWPAYRLSSIGSRWLVRKKQQVMVGEVFMEWLALVVVLQAVVWPLQITGQWFVQQTLLVDGILISWSMLAAVIVAWGSASLSSRKRTIAMLGCMLLIFGGILIKAVVGSELLSVQVWGVKGWVSVIGPLEALWVVSGGDSGLEVYEQPIWWKMMGGIFLIGVIGWLSLTVYGKVKMRGGIKE
ncbi:hypothetical protein JD969_10370 [Planctomycetota bacterium]|nr:hypothetical protein JD969_10370 [Planctomycetota bacterium]